MPVVTSEPITALAHCAQMSEPGIRCAGYEQAEVAAIRETTAFVYADSWGGIGSSDPFDAAIANLVERTVIRVLFADESDRACPSCGSPREVSDQVRPQYQRLTDVEPDELLRRQRVTERAANVTATAAERQAAALEALVLQGERAGEVEQLRALVERQAEQIDRLLATVGSEPANGSGKATARKRTEG